MSNEINQKVAEEFLGAFKDRDMEGIRRLAAENIEWTLPGEGRISGTAVGIDAVIERIKIIAAGGVKTKLNYIVTGQNGVALLLNNTGTSADGLILDEQLATVLTIDNGLIVKIDTYLSDVPMMEKYF